MKSSWWLAFPVFRCPHCGGKIESAPGKGIKFEGRFKLPRRKKEVKTDGEDRV